MNQLKNLTDEELVEMVGFPERFEIFADGYYHRIETKWEKK